MKNTTGTSLPASYNKTELVKSIKQDVAVCSTPYDLVRMDNAIITTEAHREVIAEMLLELNEFSNVSRKMTMPQIVETVRMLLQQYSNLTLQEYQVFFNRIRAGHYGQLYESLDGIKVMAFMREFYEEMNRAWNERVYEQDYQRKVESGARDIESWQGR